jgi:hypothetical protein
MHRRFSMMFVVCATLTGACMQQLDTGAASDQSNVDPPGQASGAKFPIVLDTPAIGLAADPSGDATDTTTDPCDKVRKDAMDVRQRNCSACHEGTDSVVGAPLNFVLDDSTLTNPATVSAKYGKRYIIPGDPDNSLIYLRAAIVQDMPPSATDVRNTSTTVTISEQSVLRQWILTCAGTSTTAPSAN